MSLRSRRKRSRRLRTGRVKSVTRTRKRASRRRARGTAGKRKAPAQRHAARKRRPIRVSASLNKPLNLLYLVHTFYPESYTGTEKFVLNMAKSMQKKGHRVKVATYSKGAPETFPHRSGTIVYREYDYEGVPVLAYRHEQLPAGGDDPEMAQFAQETLLGIKPDLVHIGHPMRAVEFMQSCLRLGIRYTVTLTDFWIICPRSILLQQNNALCLGPQMGENCRVHCQIPDAGQRLAVLTPLLKSAARVFSPSEALANLFRISIPDLTVEVLHHGMNYESIRTNERVYGPGDRLTLFYGGSLNPHKGVHLIVHALSMVPSDRIGLRIYGSGDEGYTESLRQAAAGDPRIIFCGPYSEQDIPHIYQEVDAAVVPSIWYENYPLALHEALVSRVPVLASDIGGMAEKVRDGMNGFTFRVGDAGHLAERIAQLLDNPTLLNHLKTNMSQMQIPSADQEADAYEQVYRSVVRPSQRRNRRPRPA